MSSENNKKGFTRANLSRLFFTRRVFICLGVIIALILFWRVAFGDQNIENQWNYTYESEDCGPTDDYICWQTISTSTTWSVAQTKVLFLAKNLTSSDITLSCQISWGVSGPDTGISGTMVSSLPVNDFGIGQECIFSSSSIQYIIDNGFNTAGWRALAFWITGGPKFHIFGANDNNAYPAGQFLHYNHITTDANVKDMRFSIYTTDVPEPAPPYPGYIETTSTSTELVMTCDPESGFFVNSLCRLAQTLFSPTYEDLAQFTYLKDALINKPPIGYFYAIKSAFSGIASTSTKAFQIASLGPISTYIFDPLKIGFIVIMWLGFGIWIFNRIRNLEL